MHGSPPCAVTVERFGAWRAAVAAIALAAFGSLCAWLVASPLASHAWIRAAVAAGALATLALAVSLWRQPAVRLRWDGLAWTVGPAGGALPEVAGRIEVAIDLGSFLLLRFLPSGRSGPAAGRWIPVGRPGLEHDWHVFRCALRSPQPLVDPGAAESRQP